MSWNDPLTSHLLDFLFEIKKHGLTTPLTIAGGFGLFLKRRYLAEKKERTLLDIPGARSTEDIDIFVRAEILCSEEQSLAIPATLCSLGYEAVTGAEYMQWQKPVEPGTVKIDLLVGNVDVNQKQLKIKYPRVRNKSVEGFHARTTPEAILVEEKALEIPLKGWRSNGVEYETTIYIPHPFTYLVMKLFAFRDRQENEKKQHGSHHAFDVFSIIGLLTEQELNESIEFGKMHAPEPNIQESKRIVQDCFTGMSPNGMVAIKNHQLYKGASENDYAKFLEALKEIFNVE